MLTRSDIFILIDRITEFYFEYFHSHTLDVAYQFPDQADRRFLNITTSYELAISKISRRFVSLAGNCVWADEKNVDNAR